MTVEVYGIRHHGPGSARSVRAALDELRARPGADRGLPRARRRSSTCSADADMVPPVAGLVYAVDEPRKATFYPLAAFSPEWVAVRWALGHGVPVRFADLPATHAFALADEARATDRRRAGRRGRGRRTPAVAGAAAERLDPIGDARRRRGLRRPRALVGGRRRAARTTPRARALRRDPGRDGGGPRGRRAARRRPRRASTTPAARRAMRRVLRAEIKAAPESRIAVVCGAYHAPALVPADFPPGARDTRAAHRAAQHQGGRHLGAVDVGPAGLRQRLRRRGRRARAGTSTCSTT